MLNAVRVASRVNRFLFASSSPSVSPTYSGRTPRASMATNKGIKVWRNVPTMDNFFSPDRVNHCCVTITLSQRHALFFELPAYSRDRF